MWTFLSHTQCMGGGDDQLDGEKKAFSRAAVEKVTQEKLVVRELQ